MFLICTIPQSHCDAFCEMWSMSIVYVHCTSSPRDCEWILIMIEFGFIHYNDNGELSKGEHPPSSCHIVRDLIRQEDVEHVHISPVCDQFHRCIKHLQKIFGMITKGDLFIQIYSGYNAKFKIFLVAFQKECKQTLFKGFHLTSDI